MVGELRDLGAVRSGSVAAAFSTVPRHLFAPGEPLERAYATMTTLHRKQNGSGAATSVVSASEIQAAMLEQARIEPGMRVLEIGSGGYNAALIAELVGRTGKVVSADIDPEIADRARRYLDAAGYGRVDVVLGDAAYGVPEHAPFDRIIVTAGAWDIPPAWTGQLAEAGRIVVPLRMRGLTRSVAFEREGDRLVSRDYRLCAFVPMQGAGAHSEQVVALDEGRVSLLIDTGQPVDAAGLRKALLGPRTERWGGMEFGDGEPLHGLDLWIATAVDGFGLVKATKEAVDSGLASRSALYGGKAIVAGNSFAYRASARPVNESRTRFEFGAYAHGPEAERLAEEYIDHIRTWDRDHRGGSGARIEVFPAATPDAELPAGRIIDKNHTRIVISWP
ncbi:methyltransferase, FxLD system [Thermobifida halotolerans]|uniref:Protein-L-isoaspartate O-methyltransferase n=2 Tax=Thermobifida halotolerans TaxID=483545 RepID=A0AA97M6D8_9ACTN|nr:methyltransferase, FxLD system [Thermobifida halotolerans]